MDSCNETNMSVLDETVISQVSMPFQESTSKAIFCHLNARSLLSKLDEMRCTISAAKRPVVFGVSETWLDSSVTNGEVSITSYDLHRRDRNGKGGGVLVYVPEACRSKRREDLEVSEIEIVWVEIRLNKRAILLGNIYRPPSASIFYYLNWKLC